jgi:GTP-binding protein
VVRDAASGCILGDLIAEASELIVAHGGKGGLGNLHWKSSTNRAPREHTDGGQGEETVLRLELKLIADGGLVGYPNAGKSALTGKLTHAHPKVASYPFTTLNPIIGTIVLEDYERITIADIPGLIKGAHTGTGLGHAFLRHIERSLFLIYVVDMAGYEGRPPHEDYLNLREELRLHQEDLVRRPSIVVANKMDLPEAAEHLKVFKRKTRTRPIPVSALTGDGIDALRQAICDLKKKAAGQPSIASR